jgi:hypothetical protein
LYLTAVPPRRKDGRDAQRDWRHVSRKGFAVLIIEILVPAVWFLVVAIVLAVCSVSARGDAQDETASDAGGWMEIGTLWFFAPEPQEKGGPGQSQFPDILVRELSWV